MNKSLKLVCLLLIFVSGCASTDKIAQKETPEIVVSRNSVVELKASNSIECETLLDECALVVDEQEKAIKAQREVILKQDELIVSKDEQIDSEAAAKNRATGLAIGSSFWVLLLLLL